MEHKDWILLETLYNEQNITKAAELLYLSQPALTYRLQQLEKEFNVKIVNRGRRGIQFTPQGEYLVKYSKDMLAQLQHTKQILWNMEDNVSGILRLGVASSIAANKLPDLLKRFLDQFPNVEVKVTTNLSSDLVQSVFRQDVHIGMIRGDYNWADEKHLLMEEHICIVSKKPLELNELPKLPRITFKTDMSLQNAIDYWWQEHFKQPPTIAMEVDQMETCKEMALNELGYAILPMIVLDGQDNLYKIPLTNKFGEPLYRRSWMIYKKESLDIKLIETFVAFVKQQNIAEFKKKKTI
ncbi:LysR family transcriptional regulator [Brevibacillus centrosporus]|uniref:LysR family transcriptional regulator n=1 Tax=Brevibacillus centrosporus TaxID=54910 RepID=UPI002E1BFC8B|nr:LysR family transcriptional regulator [Brevibacillus centrosporus]